MSFVSKVPRNVRFGCIKVRFIWMTVKKREADHPARFDLDLPSAKSSTCIAIFSHDLQLTLVPLSHGTLLL